MVYLKRLVILILVCTITIYTIVATNCVSTIIAQKEQDSYNNSTSPTKRILHPNNGTDTLNKFAIKKIYPTSEGGREWFVNMNNPKNDSISLSLLMRIYQGEVMVHGVLRHPKLE